MWLVVAAQTPFEQVFGSEQEFLKPTCAKGSQFDRDNSCVCMPSLVHRE